MIFLYFNDHRELNKVEFGTSIIAILVHGIKVSGHRLKISGQHLINFVWTEAIDSVTTGQWNLN